MKKIYTIAFALFAFVSMQAQTVLYSNTFESGVGDATIVGNGAIEASGNSKYGNVFHNAAGGQAIRTNYLLLPNTIFANLQTSGVKEVTIAFWVNKGTAVDYYWTPVFSAYGAAPLSTGNTWPMMVLQSRLVAQVNCAGWTDLLDADNVNALNAPSTTWIDDAAWHYYTATFTETSVKVYIDGVIKNAWNCNGTDGHTVNGLFSNGSLLTYICLGGNQAWNWGDPDPAYLFDDVTIYSGALTQTQIQTNITAKITTDINSVENSIQKQEFFTLNGIYMNTDFNKLAPGLYINKTTYQNGEVRSTKFTKTK